MGASRAAFADLDDPTSRRPLLGFALLASVAIAVYPRGSDWRFIALAGLALALGAGTLALSKRLQTAWMPLLPAVSALVAVGLLRHGQGGSTSGLSPLALLVIVWVAIVMDFRAVRLVTAASGLMFAIPLLLVGAPMYPSTGWRGAVLWTGVAYLVARLVHATIAEQRRQAGAAQRQSGEMEQMQRAFEAITHVARNVSLGTDARQLACEAAVASTDATLATLVEPRGGSFVITGSAGVALDAATLGSVQPDASLTAHRAGRRIFIPDVSAEPGVASVIVKATGIVSSVFEPILRDGRSVGVLSISWATRREHLDAKTLAVIQFLAAEAGAAIERADLLLQLDGQARSDPLTSLPNRRVWDETLARATEEAAPFCVAMIDIDHFKRFNDHHGHAAGDRLLRGCALAWKSRLTHGDTLARVGGEEFAALLPDRSLAAASDLLEQLRGATPLGATASVGVAQWQPGESASAVLARADAALYRAKDTGRNQLQAAA